MVSESFDGDTGQLIARSDLADTKLAALVSGHLVNCVALVPSTLYADMALTMGQYMYQKLRPNDEIPGMNVCDMEVFKPLVALRRPTHSGQHIEVESTANLQLGGIRYLFRTVSSTGILLADHGTCMLKFENVNAWLDTWKINQYMVQGQVDQLQRKLENEKAHKVLQGLAYKLFSALVTYDKKYQGMREVTLDAKETEGSAQIAFQADETNGAFFCSPYWIDSLCHISGFVVNATDLIDSATDVYISHGWKSMRFARPFSAGKQYRSYVRMQSRPKNIKMGDVYIFEGGDIVGKVGGVKFQQIPRKLLNTFLPGPSVISGQRPEILQKPTARAIVPKSQRAQISTSEPTQTLALRASDIVASETGVERSELVADTAFDNLGIDSLMSISMAARFHSELGVELSTSMFTDFTTIGDVLEFFGVHDRLSGNAEQHFPSGSSSSHTIKPSSINDEVIATPQSGLSLEGLSLDSGNVSGVREIISREMDIDPTELADDTDLSTMGMDSLMNLTIMAALQEKYGVELPSMLLVESPTIKDIELAMGFRSLPILSQQPTQHRYVAKPGSQEVPLKKHISNASSSGPSKVLSDLSQCPTCNFYSASRQSQEFE
ncbi:hypothetical protein ONS95_005126 [Cadophora gregata]|uniref:uncharacterized protein n=1 Tax=Cadophora gregata TaxID=51156 RepID=UPI0026DB21ED|nr:uncharacterized protein ONS95_005126 [Cadophora gregata]KAK0104860.1 hypothetical protein ONS95_005126 [Cadophora gregata]KAK0115061.1 hypothetical protein ONS96_013531 [Cadophora gregata f. sp. sojae]